MSRKEFRLSGSGGQGLILAAIILADAAAHEGSYVVQTQSYGPEARGGASKAEVIIDDEEIEYPKVMNPDFVLTMSDKAYDKYGTAYKEDGMLLVDSTFVKEIAPSDKTVVALPITKYAREDIGKEIVSNIVALGVINGLTKVIGNETLKNAILDRTPAGTEALNVQAYELGLSLAKKYQEENK
jgi:2-oxoglutarate ferredoxin oxidoreductase subunit gamma